MSGDQKTSKKKEVNRILLFIGTVLITLGISMGFLFYRDPLAFLTTILLPVWFLSLYPYYFLLFTVNYSGVAMTMVGLIEQDRKHGLSDIIQYVFPLGILSMVSLISKLSIYSWIPFLGSLTPSSAVITLDGLLIFILGFLIASYRGGEPRKQAVFWFYIIIGIIIFFNAIFLQSPKMSA